MLRDNGRGLRARTSPTQIGNPVNQTITTAWNFMLRWILRRAAHGTTVQTCVTEMSASLLNMK